MSSDHDENQERPSKGRDNRVSTAQDGQDSCEISCWNHNGWMGWWVNGQICKPTECDGLLSHCKCHRRFDIGLHVKNTRQYIRSPRIDPDGGGDSFIGRTFNGETICRLEVSWAERNDPDGGRHVRREATLIALTENIGAVDTRWPIPNLMRSPILIFVPEVQFVWKNR